MRLKKREGTLDYKFAKEYLSKLKPTSGFRFTFVYLTLTKMLIRVGIPNAGVSIFLQICSM